MNQQARYARLLRALYPTLTIHKTNLIQSGQYNDVLVVNGHLAFRFPGEPFFRRCARHYPQMESALPRIRFYHGTFALQEALFGLENNDPAAFKAGIREYS